MNQENKNTSSKNNGTKKPRKRQVTTRKSKASKASKTAAAEVTPRPGECKKFGQGHHMHYIGYNIVYKRGGWVPVTGLRVEGNWAIAEIDGKEVLRGWHHNAELLRHIFLRAFNTGGEVMIQPGSCYLLYAGSLITLSPDGPTPCMVSWMD